MAFAAAGTTFSFNGGTVSDLVDFSFSEEGNEVDVSNLSSSLHEYEVTIKDTEITITVNGVSTVAIGDTGAGTFSFPSDSGGGTATLANSVCTGREISGDRDGGLQTALTFKPAPAA